MDDLMLGLDDDEKERSIRSQTLRAPQNDNGVHHQHGRLVFQEDDRQRKKSKTEDITAGYDRSLLEPLSSSASSPLLTTSLNNNPLNHQGDLMGFNHLIRLQQSQPGFQQQDSGQSRPEGRLQQLHQQLEATDGNPQAMLMPAAGSYQVYTGTASNHEAGGTSPLPQPRPLGPMTERSLQATSPSRASFQPSNHTQARPQREQLQLNQPPILSSRLAGLQQASPPLLPNPIVPQGFQLSLTSMQHQAPPRSLINVDTVVQPSPSFSASMLNPNFTTSLGGTVLYPPAAAALLPVPLRETPMGSSPLTGKKPITLYMDCDDDSLSPYQCLVRKHIELFEADREEVDGNAKGRNKPIVLGQVGIRCRHCSTVPAKNRGRGSKYYPAKLSGLYQAAQSMASGHLCNFCNQIPQALRGEMLILREKKSSAGGGKKYWADGVRVLGVVEDQHGLRFKKPPR